MDGQEAAGEAAGASATGASAASALVDRPVLGADDAPLGRVESAVISPRTGRLARLVVELAGAPRHFVVLPAEWIADAIGDFVRLDRLSAEAGALPLHRRAADGWLRPAPGLRAPAFRPRPDAVVRAEVAAALAAEPLTADGRIEIEARHGVVALRGRVRSLAAAFQAGKLARSTPGAWLVRNQLVSDDAIANEVRRRLQSVAAVKTGAVRVEVDLGRVHLSGAVPAGSWERVMTLARTTPHVEQVATTMAVLPDGV